VLLSKAEGRIITISDMDTSTLIIGGGLGVVLGIGGGLLFWHLKKEGRNGRGSINAKRLAESLRDEKLKSEIILNAIEDGVLLLDGQKTIQLFNPGACNITGWKGEEARGLDYRGVLKLVDDKDNPYTEDTDPFMKAYKQGVTVRDNKAILITRSEKHISLSISVSPLLDEHKQVQAAVAVIRDVSQERQQEEQRAEFISTASHEMRTPVAAIEGYLALALNDKVSTIDARAKGYLEKAHSSTRHLGELFQDLLTSAKAEDGRLISHPSLVEMGDFLENLASDLRFSAEKKNLPVEFIIGSHRQLATSNMQMGNKVVRPLYYTHVDPDRIREVITNVFDNAVKYTEKGKISLGLTGNESVVQIYVRDTGPGIPAEDATHLFQKFYRVDNSATRTIGGTGLGLFICRKIVELYSGKIWVESKLGEGSVFYINLPRISNIEAENIKKTAAQTVGS
jgi:two-component system, OmpR family, sensor histidine kinase VicK